MVLLLCISMDARKATAMDSDMEENFVIHHFV